MNTSFTFKITFNRCLFDMFGHAVKHVFFYFEIKVHVHPLKLKLPTNCVKRGKHFLILGWKTSDSFGGVFYSVVTFLSALHDCFTYFNIIWTTCYLKSIVNA